MYYATCKNKKSRIDRLILFKTDFRKTSITTDEKWTDHNVKRVSTEKYHNNYNYIYASQQSLKTTKQKKAELKVERDKFRIFSGEPDIVLN